MHKPSRNRPRSKPRLSLCAGPIALGAAIAIASCERVEDERNGSERNAARPTFDEQAKAASVPDAGSIVLESGLEIRLAGLEPPRPAEGRGRAEPGFEAARERLFAEALGAAIRLETPGGAGGRDRWGRAFGQAYARHDTQEVWLQGVLVTEGLSRVRPEAEAGARLVELLALEDQARRARRGLWAETYYAVRSPEAVSPAIGSFQLVEGVVVDAAEVKGWIYLNFGPDWRQDFTAAVPPENRGVVDEAALLASPGARVRVRGRLVERNGPMIVIAHAGQIEWID